SPVPMVPEDRETASTSAEAAQCMSLGTEGSRAGLRDGEHQGHDWGASGNQSGPYTRWWAGRRRAGQRGRRTTSRGHEGHAMLTVGVAVAKAPLEVVAWRQGRAVRLGTFAQTADGWVALRARRRGRAAAFAERVSR